MGPLDAVIKDFGHFPTAAHVAQLAMTSPPTAFYAMLRESSLYAWPGYQEIISSKNLLSVRQHMHKISDSLQFARLQAMANKLNSCQIPRVVKKSCAKGSRKHRKMDRLWNHWQLGCVCVFCAHILFYNYYDSLCCTSNRFISTMFFRFHLQVSKIGCDLIMKFTASGV